MIWHMNQMYLFILFHLHEAFLHYYWKFLVLPLHMTTLFLLFVSFSMAEWSRRCGGWGVLVSVTVVLREVMQQESGTLSSCRSRLSCIRCCLRYTRPEAIFRTITITHALPNNVLISSWQDSKRRSSGKIYLLLTSLQWMPYKNIWRDG